MTLRPPGREAGNGYGAVWMQDQLTPGNADKLGAAVAAGQQVDLLVRGTQEAVADVSGGHVAAGDEHVDLAENARPQRKSLDFGQRIAAEDEPAQVRIRQPAQQIEQDLRLLERFAAGDRDAFDASSQREDFGGQRFGVLLFFLEPRVTPRLALGVKLAVVRDRE